MPRLILVLSLISIALALDPSPAHADDFYVAPDGSDDGDGSLDDPFARRYGKLSKKSCIAVIPKQGTPCIVPL